MAKKITIDGFNGTGKSTLAKSLANELGYTYVSMGLVFRALAYRILKKSVAVDNIEEIQGIFSTMKLHLPNKFDQRVLINGEDVTNKIMHMEYANTAIKISNNPLLQHSVREYIRKFAIGKNIIVDGRDTGRLLFPDADLKLALKAELPVRAERRMKENRGGNLTIDEVVVQLVNIDKELTDANCLPPEDAIVIDTTHLAPSETLSKALEICRDKGIRPTMSYANDKGKDIK